MNLFVRFNGVSYSVIYRTHISLHLARFTDERVAENYRDWIARTIPEPVLIELIRYGLAHTKVPDDLREWGELIVERRKHPAADTTYYASLKNDY